MKISAQTKRRWRNRLLFVGIIVASVAAYVVYIHSFTIYDYSHLTVREDFGAERSFEPIAGSLVDGKVRAAQTDDLALYICEQTTQIAVVDLRNNYTWYSTPENLSSEPLPFQQNTMRSHIGFRFYDEFRQDDVRWLYPDSITHGHEQFEIFSIENGVRIKYLVGDLNIGIDALPFFIEKEFFEERVRGKVRENIEAGIMRTQDMRDLEQFWFPVPEGDEMFGYWQMTEATRRPIATNTMLTLFEGVGWTEEDTAFARSVSGIEPELDFDYFNLTLEFVLDGNKLIANFPLSEFTSETQAKPFILDFLKFFGAGDSDAEGFMLVPSGSGGVINFNNGKQNEARFMSSVYGMDNIINIIRPQVIQPVRLPVFGIRNEGAAFLAHVQSGAALASVNAEVSGFINAFNNAWFSFRLRSDTQLTMPGGGDSMTVVQDEKYDGDITVIYHFIADEEPGVGDMARVYQDFLVEQGVLTPLGGAGDRSFYMDVVGAIDIMRHFVGTPYVTTEVMTTLEDAGRFVDKLNEGGINTIQMQLHGWFNRGINHDVAKNVRPIEAVGTRREMLDLNKRLQRNGGGLHPAVNFQFTNWYSRNFNNTFEAAKDLAGYVGFMSRHAMRDSLTVRLSPHRNDWYILVHPGVLPFHVSRFLPAFLRKTEMDGLALLDLGDTVNESLFRRDAVDRESSALIAREQIGEIKKQVPNLVVFGGNDYSLRYASHLVDVPTQSDWQYIIDYEVPFFSMVMHGFIEFAGRPVNMREDSGFRKVLLNSMTTGASPRYTFTATPTRQAQFSPHERLYSTYFENWREQAIEHYEIFNDVFSKLRGERIVDFEVLAGGYMYVGGQQVTVTEFSDGTRIYVNNTTDVFDDGRIIIQPQDFKVVPGGRNP
jgi:hypothetical protein